MTESGWGETKDSQMKHEPVVQQQKNDPWANIESEAVVTGGWGET